MWSLEDQNKKDQIKECVLLEVNKHTHRYTYILHIYMIIYKVSNPSPSSSVIL